MARRSLKYRSKKEQEAFKKRNEPVDPDKHRSEDSIIFHQMRERKKEGKRQREKDSLDMLVPVCGERGILINKFAPWHYRLTRGKSIDIFPQSKKYHNLETNTRGTYKDLKMFIQHHWPEVVVTKGEFDGYEEPPHVLRDPKELE